MRFAILAGRVLFALVFILSALPHLAGEGIEHAAGKGVPMAELLVPFAGFLSLIGGISVAIGFKARWGAAMLVLFLVPVTFMMHDFWNVADPQMAAMQRIMFMKNVSMMGAALMIAVAGA